MKNNERTILLRFAIINCKKCLEEKHMNERSKKLLVERSPHHKLSPREYLENEAISPKIYLHFFLEDCHILHKLGLIKQRPNLLDKNQVKSFVGSLHKMLKQHQEK